METTTGLHADIDSPLVWAAHPVRLLQAALQKPVAGGQPSNIVKNVSRGRVDGGAVPHHLTDDAGGRDGSLDNDEQREAASWSYEERTRATHTPSLGGWVGRVWDGRPPYRAAQRRWWSCSGG
eukprot:3240150-Prymnesium_polylepis.1